MEVKSFGMKIYPLAIFVVVLMSLKDKIMGMIINKKESRNKDTT